MVDVANFAARNFGQGPDLAAIDYQRTRNALGQLELSQRQAIGPLQQQALQQQIDTGQANENRINQESAQRTQADNIHWLAAGTRYVKAHPEAWQPFVTEAKRRGVIPQEFSQEYDPQKADQFLQQYDVMTAGAPEQQTIVPQGSTVLDANRQPIYTNPKTADPAEQARLDETKRHNLATEGKASAAEIDPDTLNTAAAVVAANPSRIRDYASFGQFGQSVRMAIQNRISQQLKDSGMTPNDLIQLRARAAAQPANLVKLTQQNAQIQQAEQLARANGQRLLDLVSLVDQTGIPLIEGITRSARAQAGGVDAAELKSVVNSFQTETARLLAGNPTLAGTLSDTARQDVQNIVNGNMSAAQTKRVVNRLFTEMDIRQAAAQEQIQSATNSTTVLPGSTKQGGQGSPQPQQAAPQGIGEGSTATGPGGQKIILRNGQWVPLGR